MSQRDHGDLDTWPQRPRYDSWLLAAVSSRRDPS